jgi:hypothetical protein
LHLKKKKKGDSNNIKSGRLLSANLACRLALPNKRLKIMTIQAKSITQEGEGYL